MLTKQVLAKLSLICVLLVTRRLVDLPQLGPVLRSRREDLRLTLRDVERKTGLSNAYLSQIENGKITQPAPAVLAKLAEIYDLPYNQLMEFAGHPSQVDSDKRTIVFKRIGKTEELSRDEEEELVRYLAFIRSRRSP